MNKKTSGPQMSLASLLPKTKSAAPGVSYSGDKPNPNLCAFVEQHLLVSPYNATTDTYDVPAFSKAIEATKATAIYNMHTYWSKKPHDAIRQYVRHYTKSGDLVLDPFCGSGGTALAALLEGRKAVAIDRSPAATFITKNYCTPVEPDLIRAAFERLKARVQTEIGWLYETKCDRCGGNATTLNTVYSQVFQCDRCLKKVPLFDCVQIEGETAAGKPKKVNVCPHCHENGHDEEISTRSAKFGAIPVLVTYECHGDCEPKRDERRHNDVSKRKRDFFAKHDVGKLNEIAQATIPHWYPRDRMMHAPDNQECWGVKWRAGSSNFKTVDELYTKRNLWALAAIRAALADRNDVNDALLFGFEAILINLSRMQGYSTDPRFPNNLFKGTYYVPQVGREYAVLPWYSGKITNLQDGYKKINPLLERSPGCCVSTQSATDYGTVPSNSVDYIFTDPPYADSIQYGELNFVWEAWLGMDTRWHDDEVIINCVRGRSEADWAMLMRNAMRECYRVLKPGRWISVCYHDTSEGTWALLQDIMAEVGFVVDRSDTAIFIDAKQKSYNQLNADKVNKRDLVVNFRKPKPGEYRVTRLVIPDNADVPTFRDLARQVIREYLLANSGSTKDRIFDELVSRMVRSGQMQAHNFDELLREMADEATAPSGGASRWYLKETEETHLDASEQQAEDRAASVMAKFIEKKTDDTGHEGVHYSDLFEHYLYAVKDKPRRPLADWLPDYFFKTEDGTWRLPAGDEERELKEKSRASGIGRRIKRFASMLAADVSIPATKIPSSPTLCEWIRHAKRAGLYEAGKLLYERGGLDTSKLTEEQQVEVEEDYQTCIRALQRAAGGEVDKAQKKRARKKPNK